jgi:hypothetical protein
MQTSELLEIDNTTGEIILPNVDEQSVQQIKQTKIKALQLLTPNDFTFINGTWEAKRDGLIKILSSLPISYAWEIKEKVVNYEYASIQGILTITTNDITRQSDSIGICEMSELKGSKSLHFLATRAETRALKRSIEVLFGSVINWYVVKYLVR